MMNKTMQLTFHLILDDKTNGEIDNIGHNRRLHLIMKEAMEAKEMLRLQYPELDYEMYIVAHGFMKI